MGGCSVEIADSGWLMNSLARKIHNNYGLNVPEWSCTQLIPLASGYALKYELYRNRNTK